MIFNNRIKKISQQRLPTRPSFFGIRGFTMIEMLVSISIFAVVSAVVLYNYSKFNSNLVVTNLAYEVALAVRQAQVYGLSVRANTINGQDTFTTGYGAHFDIADPKSFYFFGDFNSDGYFNGTSACVPGATDECKDKIAVQGSNEILKLCVITLDDTTTCSDSPTPITSLDISFKRPNPEALINTLPASVSTNVKAKIYIGNEVRQKVVTVEFSGQISISDE